MDLLARQILGISLRSPAFSFLDIPTLVGACKRPIASYMTLINTVL